MIKNALKSVRRQPKAVRDKIALTLAGVFTALVSVVWLYNTPERLATMIDVNEDESTPAFSQFFDNISDQVASVKESLQAVSTTSTTTITTEETIAAPVSGEFTFSPTASSSSPIESFKSIDVSSETEQKIVRIVTTSSTLSTTAESQ